MFFSARESMVKHCPASVDFLVRSHIDHDNFLFPDNQFQGDAVADIDENGMESGKPAVQGMQP
jgi:hypothetical protein